MTGEEKIKETNKQKPLTQNNRYDQKNPDTTNNVLKSLNETFNNRIW